MCANSQDVFWKSKLKDTQYEWELHPFYLCFQKEMTYVGRFLFKYANIIVIFQSNITAVHIVKK